MLLRLGGYVIWLFWAASMSWLIWHDLWPGLTAGDPPAAVPWGASGSEPVSCQAGIFNKHSHRIGTAWSTYHVIGETTRREDVIHLRRFAGIDPTLLEIISNFSSEGELDEFRLEVLGHGIPIKVEGERFSAVYGFNIHVGTLHETMRLEADAAGLIGDAFRPFASLPGLKVGQAWRMQVVNPIAIISGFGDRFVPMLVRVTRSEAVTTEDGRTIDCLVVEAAKATAWVDRDGKVIKQEVELAVGGTLTILDEPYDETAKTAARRRFPREDAR